MNRSPRSPMLSLALAALALAVAAGCGSSTPPTARPSAGAPGSSSAPATPVPTPKPPVHPVASITLVGATGETEAGSRSALVWHGVQQAAAALGATPTQVSPSLPAEITAAVPAAAASAAPAGATIVVTVGPAGAQAALATAAQYPSVVFFVVDEVIAADAPPNVHGLVFDDSETGYLAGVVAAGVSSNGSVGFVAGVEGDVETAGFLAGLRNGVLQSSATATVVPVYAGTSVDPAKGRVAVDGLAGQSVGAIVTRTDLTGYGAMREACSHQIPVVAMPYDADLLVPDVQPCLIISILRRYDVAIGTAIAGYAAGQAVPRVAVGTVENGGIAPGEFNNLVTSDVSDNLAAVVAAMKAGPPRATPGPAESPSAST